MAYTVENFKSKAALKRAIEAGEEVEVYQPGGMFHTDGLPDGTVCLEGPHYPQPHSWYATAEIKDGIIIPGTVK